MIKKMTIEDIKGLAQENGIAVEEVKPAKHYTERVAWAGGTYGGLEILFIDHDMKIILTGNTRSIKNDMYSGRNREVSRLRDLKAEKASLLDSGYEVDAVNGFAYGALRILADGNSENVSLDELRAMKD